MDSILAHTPASLVALCPSITLAEARKIVALVHRGEPLQANSSIRRVAIEAVAAHDRRPQLTVRARTASSHDPFVKFLLECEDGKQIETVRIPLEHHHRYSVCVSSQVGCAMACTFCATGKLGLARNLKAWEIIEQVRLVRSDLLANGATTNAAGRIHGVVFQGMGEPLANFDEVATAIEVLREPSALGIDARAITVCTSGLPGPIRKLARATPKVRLAWSVGSAITATRQRLMPIALSHSDEEVLDAIVEHTLVTGNRPMWAVTLLAGVNDGGEHAHALAQLAQTFTLRAKQPPRISIIPYNPIGGDDPFARSEDRVEQAFRAVLSTYNLASHKRYSGGGDVAAACGQLVASGERLSKIRNPRATEV